MIFDLYTIFKYDFFTLLCRFQEGNVNSDIIALSVGFWNTFNFRDILQNCHTLHVWNVLASLIRYLDLDCKLE